MNKCEWKNGKFEGCEDFEPITDTNSFGQMNGKVICKMCMTDIQKPEPEKPLIVKSGGTWVAHWKDVNYLYAYNTVCRGGRPHFDPTYSGIRINTQWKPFFKVELTDEIAKLRPMVCGGIQKYTLYGVLKEEGITWLLISDTLNDIEWYDNRLNDFRLATPHELQEKNK